MSKKNFLFLKKDSTPETLCEFIYKNLYYDKKIQFSKELIQDYAQKGLIRIDDRIIKNTSIPIKKDQTASIITLVQDIRKNQKPIQVALDLKDSDILWEDKDLVLVNKPSGIPTHATLDPERDHLNAALKRYYKLKNKNVPYLALHHRLDNDTSGVIMFCKNQNLNKDISELFSQREIEKTYLAVSLFKANVPDDWEIKNFLARTQSKNKDEKQKMQSVPENTPDSDFAHTSFRTLQESPDCLLIEAKPHTGRTHQIRIHLHEYGLSILGDKTYHTQESHHFPRMLLHAYQLSFYHPVTKMQLEVQAPIPKEFKDLFDLD